MQIKIHYLVGTFYVIANHSSTGIKTIVSAAKNIHTLIVNILLIIYWHFCMHSRYEKQASEKADNKSLDKTPVP